MLKENKTKTLFMLYTAWLTAPPEAREHIDAAERAVHDHYEPLSWFGWSRVPAALWPCRACRMCIASEETGFSVEVARCESPKTQRVEVRSKGLV